MNGMKNKARFVLLSLGILAAGVAIVGVTQVFASSTYRNYSVGNDSADTYSRGEMYWKGTTFTFDTAASGTTVGTLQITTGNNTGLFLDTSGRLGIGTTTPVEALTITSGNFMMTNASGAFRVAESGGTTYIQSGATPTTNSWQPLSIGPYGASSPNYLYINSSGDIGISTTTPTTAQLVVAGGNPSIDAQSGRIINVATPTQNGDAVNLSYLNSAITSVSPYYWVISGSNLYASGTSWNVGIGTTTPTAKFQVSGGNPVLFVGDSNYSSTTARTTGYIRVARSGANEDYALFQVMSGTSTIWNVGAEYNCGNTALSSNFVISQSSYFNNCTLTYTPEFMIAQTGHVGIATTTVATAQLVVAGGNPAIDVNNGRIINVATPSANGDAVNLSYLNSAISSVSPFYWLQSGSNLYPSSTSWNVGIGTTDPTGGMSWSNSTPPDLYAAGAISGPLVVAASQGVANYPASGGWIRVGWSSNFNAGHIQSYNGGDTRMVLEAQPVAVYGGGGLAVGTTTAQTAGNGYFTGALTATTLNTGQGANDLYAMDQNVRTTDSPTFANLTTGANISVPLALGTTNTSGISLTGQTATDFSYNGLYLYAYGMGFHTPINQSDAGVYVSGYAGVDIFTGDRTPPSISILKGGNVGIATSTPGSLLDVNGTAQLRGSAAGTGLYVSSSGTVSIGTVTSYSTSQFTIYGGASGGNPLLTIIDPGSTPNPRYEFLSDNGGNGGIYIRSGTSRVESYGSLYLLTGNTTPGSAATSGLVLDASGNGTLSGNLTVNGGKLNVSTVDPVYTIGGVHYATYLPEMTGVNAETTGNVQISNGKYVLNVRNAQKGSDLWLWAQATNLAQRGLDGVAILLTPSFDGQVWYEKDSKDMTITIYAEPSTNYPLPTTNLEVSYRLSAPRFDSANWPNTSNASDTGFNLDQLFK